MIQPEPRETPGIRAGEVPEVVAVPGCYPHLPEQSGTDREAVVVLACSSRAGRAWALVQVGARRVEWTAHMAGTTQCRHKYRIGDAPEVHPPACGFERAARTIADAAGGRVSDWENLAIMLNAAWRADNEQTRAVTEAYRKGYDEGITDGLRLTQKREKDARPPVKQRAWLYLMESSGRLKIGFSNAPTERAAALSGAAAPVKLVAKHRFKNRELAKTAEAAAHKRFASMRVHLEWFEDHADIRGFFAMPTKELRGHLGIAA